MPRAFSSALNSTLQSAAIPLANCALLQRSDGVQLGFTSLDSSFTYQGVLYESVGSIRSSAVKSSSDQGVDNMEIVGLLSSDLITDVDLRAGRYDDADVWYFYVNWMDLTQGWALMLRGKIGEVTLTDGQWKAEFRSLTQMLQQSCGELTQYNCAVQRFGDARCKLDVPTNYTTFHQACLVVTAYNQVTIADSNNRATGTYSNGVLRGVSGNNDLVEREIKMHTNVSGNAVLTLRQAFEYPITVGDYFDMEWGCDRRFSTCHTTYSNQINYRGFPHLPGTDRLVQTGRIPG